MSEQELFKLHLNFGLDIRNKWMLWYNSRLAMWFKKYGILHPDDMSHIILHGFWKDLNGYKVSIDELINDFHIFKESYIQKLTQKQKNN